MKKNTEYNIGEFAKTTGMSVRTLHYYDEIGLLTPDKSSHSGHRIYKQEDILTLHKIVSYKFLGYTLAQIKQMIREPHSDSSLSGTLQLQQKALEEKKARIEIALKAVNRAMTLLAEEKDVDSLALLSVIHSIQTEQEQQEWLQQHISEDAVHQLYNKPIEKMEELDKRSIQLHKEIQRLKGRPVHDPEVQQLVKDQMKMNLAFVGQDNLPDYSGLAALEEEDLQEMQSLTLSPYSPEEEAWLQQAMEYYIAQNGFEFPE